MGKLIDPKSLPSTRSELSLFDVPTTQVAFESARWLTVQPSNAVNNTGPYIFSITDNRHFLQLSKSYVVLKLRLNKPDGGNIAFCNYIGATFFNQVKMEINNTQVFECSHYAYKAYLEALLNHGSDQKSGILEAGGFRQDDKSLDIEDPDNKGYQSRLSLLLDAKTVSVVAPLHIDHFSTDRLIVPHVSIQFQFHRNSDAFVLESHDGKAVKGSVDVLSMHLLIHQVNVVSSASLALEKTLLSFPAKYPYRKTKLKVITVEGGRHNLPFSTLSSDVIPRRIIVGCLDQASIDGDITRSPFAFRHNFITDCRIDAGGVSYPAQPVKCCFETNDYAEMFALFYENIGAVTENRPLNITFDQFKNGFTLFAFNLSATDGNGDFELIRTGATQISMHFAKKTPSTGIQVLIYSETDGLFQIDHFRNVYSDNQV